MLGLVEVWGSRILRVLAALMLTGLVSIRNMDLKWLHGERVSQDPRRNLKFTAGMKVLVQELYIGTFQKKESPCAGACMRPPCDLHTEE